jgi:large subunit ribosomal protein L10
VNREQKAAAIAEIASQIQESEAVYAVDYRGISVPQAAELRARLRDADAVFRIVKNTLTERAADEAGATSLKTVLEGPTALMFVRGDAALAAKALRDYARTTPDLLPFKGGLLNGDPLDADQIRSIAALPAREMLYAQLVGVTASPLTGLVRGLGALIGGLAIALGQVREKKESGELPAGEAPAGEEAPTAAAPSAGEEAPTAAEPSAGEEGPTAAEPSAGEEASTATEPSAGEEAPTAAEPSADASDTTETETQED